MCVGQSARVGRQVCCWVDQPGQAGRQVMLVCQSAGVSWYIGRSIRQVGTCMLVGKLAGIGMQICWSVSQLRYIGRYVVWCYSWVR